MGCLGDAAAASLMMDLAYACQNSHPRQCDVQLRPERGRGSSPHVLTLAGYPRRGLQPLRLTHHSAEVPLRCLCSNPWSQRSGRWSEERQTHGANDGGKCGKPPSTVPEYEFASSLVSLSLEMIESDSQWRHSGVMSITLSISGRAGRCRKTGPRGVSVSTPARTSQPVPLDCSY